MRKLAGYDDRIRALITATPDLTPAEIRQPLGVTVALGTVRAAVAGLGLTVKKVAAGRLRRFDLDESGFSPSLPTGSRGAGPGSASG